MCTHKGGLLVAAHILRIDDQPSWGKRTGISRFKEIAKKPHKYHPSWSSPDLLQKSWPELRLYITSMETPTGSILNRPQPIKRQPGLVVTKKDLCSVCELPNPVAPRELLAPDDCRALTVAQLKFECKIRGIVVSNKKKSELADSLIAFDSVPSREREVLWVHCKGCGFWQHSQCLNGSFQKTNYYGSCCGEIY